MCDVTLQEYIVFSKFDAPVESSFRSIPCLRSEGKVWVERLTVFASSQKEAVLLGRRSLICKQQKVLSVRAFELGDWYVPDQVRVKRVKVQTVVEKARCNRDRLIDRSELVGHAVGLKVSEHAVLRFRERSGCNKSDETVSKRILYMVDRAVEVSPKLNFGVIALLNHGFREARYFRSDHWVFVVCENMVVTVHDGDADRWE